VAIAVKSARPDVEVVGVQVDAPNSIADGIVVKHIGELTGRLLDRWVDELVFAEEDDIAEAIVLLMEKAKLVVEGAGAVGVAALIGGLTGVPATGTTVVVLSGGNVDAGLLADVARRPETLAGRRLVVMTRVPDRPGSLVRLLDVVSRTGANLREVAHVREGLELHVRETGVQLVVETRGRDHADEVIGALEGAGYVVDRYSGVVR
jgi:threonine dehydratase